MKNSTFNKDTDIREYRRKLIVKLSAQTELNQSKISHLVECTQGYVSEVLNAYKIGGEEAIKSVPHPGAESSLSQSDLEDLKTILGKGAKIRGYNDDL